MFESIVIRMSSPLQTIKGEAEVDIGEVAQALLFYGSVHLVLSENELTNFVRSVGIDSVLALVEEGHLRLSVLRQIPATHAVGSIEGSTFDFVTVERCIARGQLRDPQQIVTEAFFRATQKRGLSRRAAMRFLRSASVRNLDESAEGSKDVCDCSRQDVFVPDYVRLAVREAIITFTGAPPPHGWYFEVAPKQGRFCVESNIDYGALSRQVQASFGRRLEITPALLLDCLHQARVDLHLAAKGGSELLTSQLSSVLISHRLRDVIQRASVNRLDDIRMFETVVLQGHRVADAVRAGEKSLEDVVSLVTRGHRFRSWLADQPWEANLLAEYYAAVTQRTWIDSLPGKQVRFAGFTALGLLAESIAPSSGIGATIGVAVGVVDSFLLDRMVKGWSPGFFIERELLPFVKKVRVKADRTQR